MQQEKIRYVLIWSGWVRLIHGLITAGVLFLFVSAWALQLGAVDYDFWRDWHTIVGQLLIITVVARVILMFLLPGSASWRAFLPDKAQWEGMKQMALFYLSFARFPLPNWPGTPCASTSRISCDRTSPQSMIFTQTRHLLNWIQSSFNRFWSTCSPTPSKPCLRAANSPCASLPPMVVLPC